MTIIPWERTADGVPGTLVESSGRYLIPVLLLMNLARIKMTELDMISANFGGNTILFERRVGVHLDMELATEFLGVYQSEQFEEENNAGDDPDTKGDQSRTPILCLRHARWDQKQDSWQFRHAPDMRTYVKEGEQIQSRIVFLPMEMSTEILLLIEEGQRLVQQGIALELVTRAEPHWAGLRFELIDSPVVSSLSYALRVRENRELEAWATRCQASFASIDHIQGILPDHGCFISYPHSVMEVLEQFPEESFNEFLKKVQSKRTPKEKT